MTAERETLFALCSNLPRPDSDELAGEYWWRLIQWRSQQTPEYWDTLALGYKKAGNWYITNDALGEFTAPELYQRLKVAWILLEMSRD